jgi:hypothetical protein
VGDAFDFLSVAELFREQGYTPCDRQKIFVICSIRNTTPLAIRLGLWILLVVKLYESSGRCKRWWAVSEDLRSSMSKG